MTGEVTREGKTLIENWQRAVQYRDRAVNDLSRTNKTLAECESRLADWMLPEDVDVGEKIAIWYGDSLIQVEVREPAPNRLVRITIRLRGKHGFEDGLKAAE